MFSLSRLSHHISQMTIDGLVLNIVQLCNPLLLNVVYLTLGGLSSTFLFLSTQSSHVWSHLPFGQKSKQYMATVDAHLLLLIGLWQLDQNVQSVRESWWISCSRTLVEWVSVPVSLWCAVCGLYRRNSFSAVSVPYVIL